MKPAQPCVILFPTVHDVMAAERRLRTAGLWCDMVPTPRQLSSDCGMALFCACEDLPAIESLLRESPIVTSGLFRSVAKGYEPVR